MPASTEKLGTSVVACSGVTTLAVESGCSNFKLIDGCIYGSDKKLLYAVPMKGTSQVNVARGYIGINGGAFWGSEVEKVTLPENMPNIASALLAGCTELTTVTIPSAVSYIAERAFWGCTSLTTINAKGTKAPELEEVYEDYEGQFYNVSGATIYVPKGCTDAYKEENYNYYLTIAESDDEYFAYVSTDPADGSSVKPGYVDMVFDVVFDEAVTIVKNSPVAYLRVGGETGGKVISPSSQWYATKGDNANTLRVWGADYDDYTEYFKAEEGTSYCMIIPEGVVKNAAGKVNERIVINFECKNVDMVDQLKNTTNAEVVGRYTIDGQKISTSRRGINILKMADGTVRKVVVRQ